MDVPSIIFIVVFALPLIVFMIWLVLQDKKRGLRALGAFALSIVFYLIDRYLKF